MRKALIAGTAIAGMALMAMPAFAGSPCRCRPPVDKCGCPETTVVSTNNSTVGTLNASVSNSGLNQINQDSAPTRCHKRSGGAANIETGDTYTDALVTNNVGYNKTTVAAPERGKVTVVSTNNSTVRTANVAASNSGLNQINQGSKGRANIETGNATSYATVGNIVGTNITEVQ